MNFPYKDAKNPVIPAKLETAMLDLKYALLEMGVELEFIKVNSTLPFGNPVLASMHGVGIKSVIHEDDAEVWG